MQQVGAFQHQLALAYTSEDDGTRTRNLRIDSPDENITNRHENQSFSHASGPKCTAGRTESVDLSALLLQLAALTPQQRAAIATLLSPALLPSPALPRPDDACPLDRQQSEGGTE